MDDDGIFWTVDTVTLQVRTATWDDEWFSGSGCTGVSYRRTDMSGALLPRIAQRVGQLYLVAPDGAVEIPNTQLLSYRNSLGTCASAGSMVTRVFPTSEMIPVTPPILTGWMAPLHPTLGEDP